MIIYNNPFTMLGKLAIGAAALTTLGTGAALQGNGEDTVRLVHSDRGNHTVRAAMHDAITTGDFDAWLEIVTANENTPFADVATSATFERLTEIHALHESGEHEAAKEAKESLRIELGIPERQIKQKREHHKKNGHQFDADTRAAVHAAIEANDFDAWSDILIEAGVSEERITVETFEQMADRQLHRPENDNTRRFGKRSIQS